MSRYFIPKEYLFEQTTPSDLWVITHACGYPVVDIYVTNENTGEIEKIIPFKVEYVSDSQCKVHFTRPFAGTAKIAG